MSTDQSDLFLSATTTGAFTLSRSLCRALDRLIPQAPAVRAFLAPNARTAWLLPVRRPEPGDIPIYRIRHAPRRFPRKVRTLLRSYALRNALGRPTGRIPAVVDGRAVQLRLPGRPRLPHRPLSLTIRLPR